MELPRQDPDQLLRAIRSDTSTKKSGKLKIFFGYAAGVGKTYAMLQAAHQARERGVDVVAGYIEPHARPQTAALLDGLEQLPVKQIAYEGMMLREFDIDAALKRKPQLILVDEYAHTNAEGSRHTKRYQDVQELLNAGIDVYTTVNVQHIESLNDTVASITGILVRERIPDSAFDQADQVELVDIEPAELLERLASGNVYREDQAQRATVNFFTLENLTALREIALRRCADRVNLLTESARVQSRGDYHTDERILACLSSSPSNAKIIRTAARMACADRVNLLTESARVQSRGDYHTDERILACLSSSPSNAKIIRTAARMAIADGKRQSTEPRRLPYRRAHSGMSFLVAIQRKNHSDCCKDGKSLSGNIYSSLCGNAKYSGDE